MLEMATIKEEQPDSLATAEAFDADSSTEDQSMTVAVKEEAIAEKKVSSKKERDVDDNEATKDDEPAKKKRKLIKGEKSSPKASIRPEEPSSASEELPAPKDVTSLATLGPFLRSHDNWRNYDYITPIPQICKDQPCMLGIDEAGRGPVLGPMVYGIAFCPLGDAGHLKTLGCADSKQLTEPDRDRIFDELCVKEYARNSIGWAIDVISPSYISEQMLSRVKVSLNEISMSSAIGLVNKAIEAGVNIAEVYVDTVGPPDTYQAKLQKLFPDFQITVAKKADSTYPIVSAASICAKVTRDHAMRVWQFREGLTATHEEFGSGYPGDPKTKAFLENNCDRVFGFPRLVRFSWSTTANVLERLALPMVFQDSEAAAAVEKKRLQKEKQSIRKFMMAYRKDGEEVDETEWHEESPFFRELHLTRFFEI